MRRQTWTEEGADAGFGGMRSRRLVGRSRDRELEKGRKREIEMDVAFFDAVHGTRGEAGMLAPLSPS